MVEVHDEVYDVIIIGAGISGLVCGCYLAQGKMKVLIVEKNRLPGGYCASFKRREFTFDACVHSLGSLGKDGIVSKILKELSLDKRISFVRYDPEDVVITPDFKIYFWNDLDKTIREFQKHFPKERKNISKFFKFISHAKGVSTFELKNKTFEDILNKYFHDERLKAIFSIFVFGNVGLPATYISAFTAVKFYQQFMLDGGYYPNGGEGIQEFPILLARRFQELGGTFLNSKIVNKIEINENGVNGIRLKNGKSISAKYIISNIDVRQTFLDLIGSKYFNQDLTDKLQNLEPTLSMFVCFFGVKEDMLNLPDPGVNTWFLSKYDLNSMYHSAKNGEAAGIPWYMARLLADGKSLLMFTNAPFISMEYWKKNKERFLEMCIDELNKIIPGIRENILHKEGASPGTMYKWTRNYNGAAYGWEGRPNQLAMLGLARTTPIKNLYLTGHWTTLAQGTPGVALLGRDTAQIILRKVNKNGRK